MEGHGVTSSIGVGVGTGSNLVLEVFEQVEKMLLKFSSYTSTVSQLVHWLLRDFRTATARLQAE